MKESFAEVAGNEAWLLNAHISEYSHGNRENHEPVRRRKLLLHRREIDKLLGKTREKGLTLVPTKMYLKNGRVKIEIAVGKGKVSEDGKKLPLDVKAGDRILFGKYSGSEVKLNGEELLIMREEDVLGILAS